jgi:hypothetical protein
MENHYVLDEPSTKDVEIYWNKKSTDKYLNTLKLIKEFSN